MLNKRWHFTLLSMPQNNYNYYCVLKNNLIENIGRIRYYSLSDNNLTCELGYIL